MPRPQFEAPVDAINAPTFEDIVEANANWLTSRTLPVFGTPTVAVQFDTEYIAYLASLLHACAARLLEGDA